MLWQRLKSLTSLGLALGMLLATGGMAGQCSAAMILGAAVPLADLVGDPQATITVGDKEFSSFNYFGTGDMPIVANVNVIPIKDDAGNFGIRFQGAFTDLASSPGGSDALITYIVEALNPALLISDAHLQGNPVLLGTTGSIGVTETFLALGDAGEHTMTIFDDEGAGAKLVDWTFFHPPVRRLNVQKDIHALAGDGTVTMSFVDQTFSQIPEPATVALFMLGGVGFSMFVRRRGSRASAGG